MKKVLLTGATGFIGRHCIPLLLSRGYEVVAVSSSDVHFLDHPRLYWQKANLLDPVSVSDLVEEVHCTHLLHFAWYLEPGKFNRSLKNLSWVGASLHLLQSFAAQGGKRAVMAGTCFEYDGRYGYCTEELTPLAPNNLYGTCKNALGSMLDASTRELGLSGAWGRIFFLYGSHEHPARLVSSVMLSLLRGKHAPCSHGNQVRDYLHVEDVADAFVNLLDSEIEGAVNIASGVPVTLKEIIYKIADMLDGRDLLKMGAIKVSQDEPGLLVGRVDRLSRELGWSPKFDLDRGLEASIEWWRARINEGKLE